MTHLKKSTLVKKKPQQKNTTLQKQMLLFKGKCNFTEKKLQYQ
jgi:hypothetical protein